LPGRNGVGEEDQQHDECKNDERRQYPFYDFKHGGFL
jgi:hypothetical protein